MDGDKLMHAKDAVVNFVGALRPRDEALVIAFSDGVDQLGQIGLDTTTIARDTRALRSGGGTRLNDAVLEGAKAIATSERKEKRAMSMRSASR